MMKTDKLEERIRMNAGEVFGTEVPLPSGHRGRFASRLEQERRRQVMVRRMVWYSISAAAAVFLGVLLLARPFGQGGGSEIRPDDVRNYYAMKLEEQAEAMRQSLEVSNRPDKEILLVNIAEIENEPFPDVQMVDEDKIVFIADIYGAKMETLSYMQDIMNETN